MGGSIVAVEKQDLGLTGEYKEKWPSHDFIRKLLALPLLPHEHIPIAFVNLRETATTPLQPLMTYVNTTWITGQWTPQEWSVYGQSIRTSNDFEESAKSSTTKMEKREKPRSAVVQQLIDEKRRERREKEEAEKRNRIEIERRQRFRIPKKKQEDLSPCVNDSAGDSENSHTNEINNKTDSSNKHSHSSDKSHNKKSSDKSSKSHETNDRSHKNSHSSKEKPNSDSRKTSDNNGYSHTKDKSHSSHKNNNPNSVKGIDNATERSQPWDMSSFLDDSIEGKQVKPEKQDFGKSEKTNNSISKPKHSADHGSSSDKDRRHSSSKHKHKSNSPEPTNGDDSIHGGEACSNGTKDKHTSKSSSHSSASSERSKSHSADSSGKSSSSKSHSSDSTSKSSSSKSQSSDATSKSSSGKSHSSDSTSKSSSSKSHSSDATSKPSSGKSHSSDSTSKSSSSKSHSSDATSKSSSSKSHSSNSTSKSSSSKSHSSDPNSKSSSSKSHSCGSSGKSSSSKSHHSSTSSSRHSNSSKSKSKSSSSVSDKEKKSSKHSKSKDVDLADLRSQVKKMKQDLEVTEAVLDNPGSTTGFRFQECVDGKVIDTHENMLAPLKNRHGLNDGSVDDKQIKILTKTQMILQRTKEKLAQEMEKTQSRTRGKRTGVVKGEKADSDKLYNKIKSRCTVKDGFDSDDDEVEGFENSFSEDLVKPEPGALLKNMKRNIDEKLSNYEFPDPPVKEKKEREKRKVRVSAERSSKLKQIKDKYTKLKEKEKHKHKRDKEKYSSRARDDSSMDTPKPWKKPVIVKRSQFQQPPPMNFSDLLKLAEVKSHEKVKPEPIVPVKKKKKPEERPMTQDEKDRQQRSEESRKREKEEELAYNEDMKNESPILHKSLMEKRDNVKSVTKPSDNEKLTKGTLSDKGRSSPLLKPGLNKPISNQPGKTGGVIQKNSNRRYDSEHENVLVCGPSASKPAAKQEPQRDQANQAKNPWDRIYGQIQKKNPKSLPMKRKHQVLLESDEEDEEDKDEYDEEDDFIDDDNAGEDYSAHIRNIFGYDKRKYRDIDEDDVDNMEADFRTIMKEEAHSAKVGLREDLEDMRKEQEELRMKKLAKVKKMKR